jgi:hypothetical protein
MTIAEYYATYNDNPGGNCADGGSSIECIVTLTKMNNKYRVPINVGLGFDFFMNQTIALKIDARNYFYVDEKPDYDPEDETELGKRLYTTFIASAGVSVFVPSMKRRLYDF